jgi:hypothetical protein
MSENKTHILKTWTGYYDDVMKGLKPWELRINDRDYKKGDKLMLKRYSIVEKRFTGEISEYEITYIFNGNQFGVIDGWVLMTIKPTNKKQSEIEKNIEDYENGQKVININF